MSSSWCLFPRCSCYPRREAGGPRPPCVSPLFPVPPSRAQDKEFVSTFVQTLNMILLTAAELLPLRALLKRGLEAGRVPKGTRVMTCRYCLRHALKSCGGGKAVPPLYLDDGSGARLRLEFDCRNCLMEVYV